MCEVAVGRVVSDAQQQEDHDAVEDCGQQLRGPPWQCEGGDKERGITDCADYKHGDADQSFPLAVRCSDASSDFLGGGGCTHLWAHSNSPVGQWKYSW